MSNNFYGKNQALPITQNNLKLKFFQKENKIIFNEFSESDYGSLDLVDLNEKYATFEKPNEKILSDIEWAIDKLTIEDLISSEEESLR